MVRFGDFSVEDRQITDKNNCFTPGVSSGPYPLTVMARLHPKLCPFVIPGILLALIMGDKLIILGKN